MRGTSTRKIREVNDDGVYAKLYATDVDRLLRMLGVRKRRMRLVPPSPVCNDAEFANSGLERLWLSRKVADRGPVGLLLGLNPSTAGAADTDHTITKEIEFARRWGWSGFWKGNLFTCVETYSAKLKGLRYETAIGLYGNMVLENMIPLAAEIVVCWGTNVPKQHKHRVAQVCSFIRTLRRPGTAVRCFGLSKDGDPVHPLRLGYETRLVPFNLPEPPPSRREE